MSGRSVFPVFQASPVISEAVWRGFLVFFCLMLQDENTEPKYRNFVVRYHVQWIATADNHPNCARGTMCNCAASCAMDSRDVLGLVIIDCYRVIWRYRAVLGAICTCRAWFRGVEKYLGLFDSSLEELRQLVSWDCQVPCMNRVLGVIDDDDDSAFSGVRLEDAHFLCIDPLQCVPGTGDLPKKLRDAYDDLEDDDVRHSFQRDFGISEVEQLEAPDRLRDRLWRRCRPYRRRDRGRRHTVCIRGVVF